MINLSVIIIACNEEKMIGDCLKSVRKLAGEIVLVDSGSTDRTVQLAKRAGAKVIYVTGGKLEFARWRNLGLKAAKGKWILYLDADERITPELEREVKEVIRDTRYVLRFTSYVLLISFCVSPIAYCSPRGEAGVSRA